MHASKMYRVVIAKLANQNVHLPVFNCIFYHSAACSAVEC